MDFGVGRQTLHSTMITIPGSDRVVVDADALIGLVHTDDALHFPCLRIADYLGQHRYTLIVHYPIVLEAATALARAKTIRRPDLAKKLLDDYGQMEEQSAYDPEVTDLVHQLYNPGTSKENTPFDHYVLALALKNNVQYVFSFDPLYAKHGLTLMQDVVTSPQEP